MASISRNLPPWPTLSQVSAPKRRPTAVCWPVLANSSLGWGGDDVLRGLGGRDDYGGRGDDVLHGGGTWRADFLDGGAGRDVGYGGPVATPSTVTPGPIPSTPAEAATVSTAPSGATGSHLGPAEHGRVRRRRRRPYGHRLRGRHPGHRVLPLPSRSARPRRRLRARYAQTQH